MLVYGFSIVNLQKKTYKKNTRKCMKPKMNNFVLFRLEFVVVLILSFKGDQRFIWH